MVCMMVATAYLRRDQDLEAARLCGDELEALDRLPMGSAIHRIIE
jgi:hypothetical protein